MRKEISGYIDPDDFKLPPITDEQKAHFAKFLDNISTTTRGKFHCLECGHIRKGKGNTLLHKLDHTCENCGKKTKSYSNSFRVFKDIFFGAIFQTYKGYQVRRIFWIEKYATRKNKPEYIFSEVVQNWFHKLGKSVFVSKDVIPMSYEYDKFILHSNLTIKQNHSNKYSNAYRRMAIEPYITYPKKSFISVLKRNGLKSSFHKIQQYHVIKNLLSNSTYETIWKTGYYGILQETDNFDRYFPAIKICIRNNYKIKDTQYYLDYLNALIYLEKDLSNPYYACPEDLTLFHDKYIKMKDNKQRKIWEEEKRQKNLKKNNREYKKEKKKFFKLKFVSNNIVIEPLRCMEDFQAERDAHGHCVYSRAYYKSKDKLIFSAKVNGVPKETIEFSLKDFKVKQARGKRNKGSWYHKKILEIFNSNIDKIKEIT